MPTLTILKKDKKIKLDFEGTPILRDLLVDSGIAVFSPCGGNGSCGKCKSRLSGEVSPPNEHEEAANCRLACQARLLGDAEAELLSDESEYRFIETKTIFTPTLKTRFDWKYGAAVDIGTTTVVLKLYNSSGEYIAEATALNPQRSVSADVIGRIDSALRGNGETLKDLITQCIDDLSKRVCADADIDPSEVEKWVITGNTAMLYLYTGRSPESISHSPFTADTLFGEYPSDRVYIPPCMNAFVGADITCAVLASGMTKSDKVSLLCDIGTNGEVALWKNGRLYVTSAAAGPAFEGGEISCGCGCVSGAIDRVAVENGKIKVYTIDNTPALGICGSGLISVVSAFLELGYIDNSGYGENIPALSANGGTITITQDDIRALQLAKAAIAAAVEILLKHTETTAQEIETLYICGGFGNNLSISDAAKIGLIPYELSKKAIFLGNGALSGAIEMLFDEEVIGKAECIAKSAQCISLAGEEDFYRAFIGNIDFPVK